MQNDAALMPPPPPRLPGAAKPPGSCRHSARCSAGRPQHGFVESGLGCAGFATERYAQQGILSLFSTASSVEKSHHNHQHLLELQSPDDPLGLPCPTVYSKLAPEPPLAST
eukprot:869938-Pelagomonas_calceolata.AAC.1